MINIIIQRGVHLYNLPKELKQKIKTDLTFDNPQYVNAKRYGKFIHSDIEPYLKFYGEDKLGDVMYIPKGYAYFILKTIKKLGLAYKIQDQTAVFPKLNLSFYGEDRDYQEDAIEDILRYPIGVLESGTGSGKTAMGIKIIQKRQQPTLIVVHNKELLRQWTKQIKNLLHYDVGLIGDGKNEVKDITVGIVNSVRNRINELKDRFGFVICDEVHRCPSSTWTDVLCNFSARYQLGLSATAFRSDGLSHAIYAFIGPKIHKVDREMLNDIGAVLVPDIQIINSNFRYYYDGVYSSLISSLVADDDRNNLLANTVKNHLKEHNSAILVVSDRVSHCNKIQELLLDKGVVSSVLTAETPKEERERIVEALNNGEEKVVNATSQLIGEGFDCPNLHALLLATHIKYKGKLIQVVGRILRPSKDKMPIIYDVRDDNIKPLKQAGKERDKTYQSEWGK